MKKLTGAGSAEELAEKGVKAIMEKMLKATHKNDPNLGKMIDKIRKTKL